MLIKKTKAELQAEADIKRAEDSLEALNKIVDGLDNLELQAQLDNVVVAVEEVANRVSDIKPVININNDEIANVVKYDIEQLMINYADVLTKISDKIVKINAKDTKIVIDLTKIEQMLADMPKQFDKLINALPEPFNARDLYKKLDEIIKAIGKIRVGDGNPAILAGGGTIPSRLIENNQLKTISPKLIDKNFDDIKIISYADATDNYPTKVEYWYGAIKQITLDIVYDGSMRLIEVIKT